MFLNCTTKILKTHGTVLYLNTCLGVCDLLSNETSGTVCLRFALGTKSSATCEEHNNLTTWDTNFCPPPTLGEGPQSLRPFPHISPAFTTALSQPADWLCQQTASQSTGGRVFSFTGFRLKLTCTVFRCFPVQTASACYPSRLPVQVSERLRWVYTQREVSDRMRSLRDA